MIGFFGHNLEELAPPDTSAQYQDPRAGSVPSPYGPGSPLIPAERPDVFYSDPNPATAPLPTGGPPVGILQQLANGLATGINSHPLTLMSLGAGIAQGGVGRGLDLATAAAQAERNLQAQQVNHAHVFNALTGAGVPPDEALAAVLNPSLMRALAVKYLGPHSGGRSATAAPGAVSTSAVAGSNTYNPPPASAGASATATTIPAYPASVPSGAYFSRSRNLWEDPDGNLFDLQGRPVK